jgi:hypothetical protein
MSDWGSSGRRFKSCQSEKLILQFRGGFPEFGNRLFHTRLGMDSSTDSSLGWL